MSQTGLSEIERKRNAKVAVICAFTFFGMIGASFAAVPIYRAFCQLTGFDGTPRRATAAAGAADAAALAARRVAGLASLPEPVTEGKATEHASGGGALAAARGVPSSASPWRIVHRLISSLHYQEQSAMPCCLCLSAAHPTPVGPHHSVTFLCRLSM